MIFIIAGYDKEGMAHLREENRYVHLAYWESFSDKVKFGGPFLDSAGEMCGSMLALEAENEHKARQIAENDPYNKKGLFVRLEVRGWKWVINAPYV